MRKGHEWICLPRNCGSDWEALYELRVISGSQEGFPTPAPHPSTPRSLQPPAPGPRWPCHLLSMPAPPFPVFPREPVPCLPASRRRPGIWTSSKFPWVRHLSRGGSQQLGHHGDVQAACC